MILENFYPVQTVKANGLSQLDSPPPHSVFTWFQEHMNTGELGPAQKDRIYDALGAAMKKWAGED